MTSRCSFDYICAVDFEATCIDSEKKDFYPHEIIEFPCFLIDVQKQEIVSSFHSFVKPVLNPRLTDFCKELTGISQEDVDNADMFETVLSKFWTWISSFLTLGQTFIMLSDGPWDMSRFLTIQCHISKIDFPTWGKRFIDIKATFKYHNKMDKVRLMDMLRYYGLSFSGHLHCGKDDAYNVAMLVLTMLKRGCEFLPNGNVSHSILRSMQIKVSAYLGEKQKDKKQKKKSNQKLNNEQILPETGVMDIDPDIIGTESVLIKHKSKS